MADSNGASYLADFDSATAMLRALSNYLRGADFPLLGAMPRTRAPLMKIAASVVNQMPKTLREQVYIWSGRLEAISPRKLRDVNTAQIAEWVTRVYPNRRYPAVAVGSSNGAAVHLWAALGIPWLPQTFLIPVARTGVHPDEPVDDANWARQPAEILLERNPDIQLHHMNDPNQDRLMIQRMSYFRIKQRRVTVQPREFYQRGAGAGRHNLCCGMPDSVAHDPIWPPPVGGATVNEYLSGGKRVEEYLARYGSHRRRWLPPEPDGESPEAEWGFEPALREDLISFADRNGFRVRRILFDDPEQMSPLVADLYAWWNRKDITDERLLVDSFILMEPFWTARTGSIPFWMMFNKEPSASALHNYLRERDAMDEIYLMLFSHGVDSVGLVPIDQWRRILKVARKKSAFIGVDERAYPRDFAVFVRYHADLPRKIAARYPLPAPLSLRELDEFVNETSGRYQVEWQ